MRFSTGSLLATLTAFFTGISAGHDSLYHYAEASLKPAAGVVEFAFSIHVGDLASARALGADPNAVSLDCLLNRRPEEIEAVRAEARDLIESTIHFDGEHPASWILPDAMMLSRDPAACEGARPGFLIATCQLPASGPMPRLNYLAGAQKRLLLVVARPGRFPLVRDLAPGSVEALVLVQPPSRS